MVVKELVALLGVQTDQNSIKKGETALGGLAKYAKIAGAAIAGFMTIKGIANAVTEVADLGKELGRISARTGASVDFLQKFAYVSKASLGEVEVAIRKLQIAQMGAEGGSKDTAAAFKKLGVSTKDEKGQIKDSSRLFLEMADGFKNLKTDAERSALAVKFFGRGGATMIPILKKGRGAILEQMQELEDYGGLLSGDVVEAGRKFGDSQRKIKASVLGIKIAIAQELLPKINRLAEGILKWWRENGKLIRQNISKVFEKLGDILERVVSRLGKIVAWLIKLYDKGSPTTKKIMEITGAVIALNAAFKVGILNKGMLIIIAIALALEDIDVFLKGGNSSLGQFCKWLEKVSGIDIAPVLRDFAQALNILSVDPEPFDWSMGGEELTKVIDNYLAAARQTWKNWWTDIVDWYISNFVENNPIANYFGALLNIIATWGDQAINIVFGVFEFLLNVWDQPKEAFLNMINTLKTAWYDFYESIRSTVGIIMDWFSTIGGWLSEKGGKVLKFFGFKEGEGKGAGTPNPELKGAKTAIENLPTMTSVPGAGYMGGGPATMSVPASSGSTVINAPANIPITINARAGMNEKQIGAEVGRHVQSALDKQNRKTLQALTPQKAI